PYSTARLTNSDYAIALLLQHLALERGEAVLEGVPLVEHAGDHVIEAAEEPRVCALRQRGAAPLEDIDAGQRERRHVHARHRGLAGALVDPGARADHTNPAASVGIQSRSCPRIIQPIVESDLLEQRLGIASLVHRDGEPALVLYDFEYVFGEARE